MFLKSLMSVWLVRAAASNPHTSRIPFAVVTYFDLWTINGSGSPDPVLVPKPFAGMLTHHLHNRPNLATGGGMIATACHHDRGYANSGSPTMVAIRHRVLATAEAEIRCATMDYLFMEI